MYTKEDLIETIEQETNICKHLFSKIPNRNFDYRPSDNQRSTFELLQYLTMCVTVPAKGMIQNDWTFLPDAVAEAKTKNVEQFCELMDQQLQEFKSMLNGLSDEDMKRKTSTPMRTEIPLGKGLVNLCLRFITAYKLQLFLHAKAAGGENLSTSNAWMGMDKPAA